MNIIEKKFNLRDYGYTIISRFEGGLRDYLYKIINENYSDTLEAIPKGVLKSATERNHNNLELSSIFESVDFIHLKEIVIYRNNYSLFFNVNNLKQKEFIDLMNSLYDIRCKIAHIRGMFTQLELTSLIEESKKIINNLQSDCREYLEFLMLIQDEPDKLIKRIPIEFIESKSETYSILNNIPMADYEYEGGFVGRQEDINKIIKMIEAGDHRVITISGAGGVGKSALILKVVNEILDNNMIEFDSVIWVSAKENKLTYLGVEDLEPTLKNYDELLDTILEVMGFDSGIYSDIDDKEEDIRNLLDCCNRVLLVIDNLETITDERIINFILDAHRNTSILITSRKGLGQVERRYDLKELNEKEAIRLFRIISKEKKLDALRVLEDGVIRKYVNKVYCYPLAIKWVLGQVAIGKDINEIIDSIKDSTSDISKFCFDQIYNELTEDAKLILCTLSLFEDSVIKGVVKYITNLDAIAFEDSISDLVLVSLIIPEQKLNLENKEINTVYSLLPLTRGYVKSQLDCDTTLKRMIQERIITVESTMEEASRAKKQYRFSLSNLGATSEEEKVAAMFVQTAHQKYQAGNYLEAVDAFKNAINIAPRFASVYRNWATVESSEGHLIEADNLMKKASELNPNDTQIWLVWGNIKKKNDKIKEAYNYYQKAYQLSPNDNVVMNSLGQSLSRLGEYKLADEYLVKALAAEGESMQNRHKIINMTCIAENLKRWAESCSKDRDIKNAEEKLKKALENMESVIKLDNNDSRSCILYKQIIVELAFLYKNQSNDILAIEYFKRILSMSSKKYKESELVLRATLELVDIYIKGSDIDKAKVLMSKDLERIRRFIKNPTLIERYDTLKLMLNENDERIAGNIINWNIARKFGIIENLNCNGETFLAHISEFKSFINPIQEEIIGKEVTFIPERSEKNVARNIIIKS